VIFRTDVFTADVVPWLMFNRQGLNIRNCPGCRQIELSRLGPGAGQTPMGRDQDFG
jgi:hypothetical protein